MGASRAGSYEVTPPGRSRALTSSVGPTDRPQRQQQRVRLTVSQTRRETPHPSSLAYVNRLLFAMSFKTAWRRSSVTRYPGKIERSTNGGTSCKRIVNQSGSDCRSAPSRAAIFFTIGGTATRCMPMMARSGAPHQSGESVVPPRRMIATKSMGS
jgi:hypothetical protein